MYAPHSICRYFNCPALFSHLSAMYRSSNCPALTLARVLVGLAAQMSGISLDAALFAKHCPVNDPRCPSIVGVKFGENERGKAPLSKPRRREDYNGNRFKHQVCASSPWPPLFLSGQINQNTMQVQIRMRLHDAANIRCWNRPGCLLPVKCED